MANRKPKVTWANFDRTPSWAVEGRNRYLQEQDTRRNREAKADSIVRALAEDNPNLSDDQLADIFSRVVAGEDFDVSETPKPDFSNVEGRVGDTVSALPEQSTGLRRGLDAISYGADVASATRASSNASSALREADQLEDASLFSFLTTQEQRLGLQVSDEVLRRRRDVAVAKNRERSATSGARALDAEASLRESEARIGENTPLGRTARATGGFAGQAEYQLLPLVGGAVGAAYAGPAGAVAGAAAGSIPMYNMARDNAYAEARTQFGATKEEAEDYAQIMAAIEFGPSALGGGAGGLITTAGARLGLKQFTKEAAGAALARKVRSRTARIGGAMLSEGADEAVAGELGRQARIQMEERGFFESEESQEKLARRVAQERTDVWSDTLDNVLGGMAGGGITAAGPAQLSYVSEMARENSIKERQLRQALDESAKAMAPVAEREAMQDANTPDMFGTPEGLPSQEQYEADRQKSLEEDAAWRVRGNEADAEARAQNREDMRRNMERRADDVGERVELLQEAVDAGDTSSATLNSLAAAQREHRNALTALNDFENSAPTTTRQETPTPEPTPEPVQRDMIQEQQEQERVRTINDVSRRREAAAKKAEKDAAAKDKAATTQDRRERTARMDQLLADNPNATDAEIADLMAQQPQAPATPAPAATTPTQTPAKTDKAQSRAESEQAVWDAADKAGMLSMQEDGATPTPESSNFIKAATDIFDGLRKKNTQESADVQNLLGQGKIVLLPNAKAGGRSDGGAASYDPATGKMYIYTDKLDAKDTVGTMIRAFHEAGHAGEFNPRDGRSGALKSLMNDVDGSAAKVRVRAGRGNALAKEAVRLAQADTAARKAAGEANPDRNENREILAYLIGEATRKRNASLGGVSNILNDMVAGAKSLIRDNLGVDLDVTFDDLVAATRGVAGELVQTDVAPSEGDSLNMIVGPSAANWDSLGRRYTGRVDQKERAEIADGDAILTNDSAAMQDLLDGQKLPISELLGHQSLYDNYPKLANIVVDAKDFGDSTEGLFSGTSITVSRKLVNAAMADPAAGGEPLRKLLLHELQHAVQEQEGFIGGANSASFIPSEVQSNYNLSTERLDGFLKNFEIGLAEKNLPPMAAGQWRATLNKGGNPTDPRARALLFLNGGFTQDVPNRLIQRAGVRFGEVKNNLAKDRDAYLAAQRAAYATYLRNYGEGEARNTEFRANLTEEDLATAPMPEETMGMDRSGVTVDQMVDTAPLAKRRQALPAASQNIGTPEFKEWFGNSQATNPDGSPKTYYTGTSKDKDFKSFKIPKNGAWFTDDPDVASAYAVDNDSRKIVRDDTYGASPFALKEVNNTSRVFPVHLKAENPYTITPEDFDFMNRGRNGNYRQAQAILFDKLRMQGYDSVFMDSDKSTLVVLNAPTQIKSVHNSGKWDGRKPDILAMADEVTATGAPRTVPREELSNREIIKRIAMSGTRSQTADVKIAEALDRTYRGALKSDLGARDATPEQQKEITDLLTSIDNATPEKRAELWGAFTKKYPNLAEVLDVVRRRIDTNSRRLIQERRSVQVPLSQEEIRQMTSIIGNHGKYLTRAYNAFQGASGREWRESRWSNFKKYGEAFLDEARRGRMNKNVRKDVEAVMNAIAFMEAKYVIPDDKTLGTMNIGDLEDLYSDYGGQLSRLPYDRQDSSDKRDALVNALAQRREQVGKPELNRMAERAVAAMLGVETTSPRFAKAMTALAKDPGTLKKKDFVPDEIRELLGEMTNPGARIITTLSTQAALLARQGVYLDLINDHTGTLVVPATDIDNPGVREQLTASPSDGLGTRLAQGVEAIKGDLGRPSKMPRGPIQLEGEQYGPLEGYWVHPHVADSLIAANETFNTFAEAVDQFIDNPDRLAGMAASRLGKTTGAATRWEKILGVIYNPARGVANYAGSWVQLIGNGNMNVLGKSFYESIGKGHRAAFDYVASAATGGTTELLNDAYRYVNLEAADIGEIQHILGNTIKDYMDGTVGAPEVRSKIDAYFADPARKTAGAVGTAHRVVSSSYAVADNWTKVANYYDRLNTMKAYYDLVDPNRPIEAIKQEVGNTINYTNISYERVPKALKSIEGAGLTKFVPYFYEAYRTRFTNYNQALLDLKRANATDNPEAAGILHRAAVRRLIGNTIATGAMPFAGMIRHPLLHTTVGVGMLAAAGSDEDYESMRRMISEFARDQDLMNFGVDPDGNPVFISISDFFDPFGPANDMLRLVINTPKEELPGAMKDMIVDMMITPAWMKNAYKLATGQDLPASQLNEMFPNLTAAVEKDALNLGIQETTTNNVMKVLEGWMPGIIKAQASYSTPNIANPQPIDFFGQKIPGLEDTAKLATAMNNIGFRFETLNPQRQLNGYGREASDAKSDNRRWLNQTLTLSRNLTDARLDEIMIDYSVRELDRLEESYQNVRSLRTWGYDDSSIEAALKSTNNGRAWSKDEIKMLMNGTVYPVVSLKSVKDAAEARMNGMDPEQAKSYGARAQAAIERLERRKAHLEAMGIVVKEK